MKGSTKRIISILFSLALLIAAIAIYSSYVVPEYERINALRAESSGKQATLDSQRQVVDQVSTLLMKYRSIPDLRNALALVLPTNENTAAIFSQIFAVASDSGLTIQQFGVNTNTASRPASGKATDLIKGLGTAQVTLYLAGSYESFKQFLRTIEHNLRIMDVTSVKMQPVSRASSNFYFFNVTLSAYYQQ